MAQATCAREGWFTSVALVCQRRSLIKEQLSQWRVYHRGLKLLWKLLRGVDPLLPPAGPALCALHQLRSCMDDYQVSMYGCANFHSGTIVNAKLTGTVFPYFFPSVSKTPWVCTPLCTPRQLRPADIYVKPRLSRSVRADCSQSSRL